MPALPLRRRHGGGIGRLQPGQRRQTAARRSVQDASPAAAGPGMAQGRPGGVVEGPGKRTARVATDHCPNAQALEGRRRGLAGPVPTWTHWPRSPRTRTEHLGALWASGCQHGAGQNLSTTIPPIRPVNRLHSWIFQAAASLIWISRGSMMSKSPVPSSGSRPPHAFSALPGFCGGWRWPGEELRGRILTTVSGCMSSSEQVMPSAPCRWPGCDAVSREVRTDSLCSLRRRNWYLGSSGQSTLTLRTSCAGFLKPPMSFLKKASPLLFGDLTDTLRLAPGESREPSGDMELGRAAPIAQRWSTRGIRTLERRTSCWRC